MKTVMFMDLKEKQHNGKQNVHMFQKQFFMSGAQNKFRIRTMQVMSEKVESKVRKFILLCQNNDQLSFFVTIKVYTGELY